MVYGLWLLGIGALAPDRSFGFGLYELYTYVLVGVATLQFGIRMRNIDVGNRFLLQV